MSLYSVVVHPELGVEIQIRAGDDNLNEYRVGDPVPWGINPELPGDGHFLDDAYPGIYVVGTRLADRRDLFADCWVVIKDHRVHAVEPTQLHNLEDDANAHFERAALWVKYDLQPPSPESWPDALWATLLKEQVLAERERFLADGRWCRQRGGPPGVARSRLAPPAK